MTTDSGTNSANGRDDTPVRWWVAVFVGLLVSIPVGLVLSLAGPLPFFLGPFFFALLGLIVGAAMHRVGSRGRPYPVAVLLIGTTIVVLFCWAVSIVPEYRKFVVDAAADVARKTRHLGDQPVQEFRNSVQEGMRDYLRTNHASDGTLGYLRWCWDGGVMKAGEIEGVHRTIRSSQEGIGFVLRILLSIGLLTFGIASQTIALKDVQDRAVRSKDARSLN